MSEKTQDNSYDNDSDIAVLNGHLDTTHTENSEYNDDISHGRLSPSSHENHRGTVRTHQEDNNLKDRILRPGSQRDVIPLNNQKAEIFRVSPPQCEYQYKPLPSDVVSNTATVTFHAEIKDSQQCISPVFDLMALAERNTCFTGVRICFNLGSPKIHVGKDNMYKEGRDFERAGTFEKGSTADDVFTVKDKMTRSLQVVKQMDVSKFRKEEIIVALDLQKAIPAPEPYVFSLRDNVVRIHMEPIENAITLRDVMDYKMNDIRLLYPGHIWPFSRFLIIKISAVVNAMHKQKCTHGDLYGDNVCLQKHPDEIIRVVLIDYGDSNNHVEDQEEYQKDKDDFAFLVRMLIDAWKMSYKIWECNLKKTLSFKQLDESEQAEQLDSMQRILKSEPPADIQPILELLQKQKDDNDIDKATMLQDVRPILFRENPVQRPESPSFPQLGKSEQAKPQQMLDIYKQTNDNDKDKDRPLEEVMSKLPSPPDDLENIQPVHDSAQIDSGSSEMVPCEASTTYTSSNWATSSSTLVLREPEIELSTSIASSQSQAPKCSWGNKINTTNDQEQNHGTPPAPRTNIERVLKTGCMPLLPPARRAWGEKQVDIGLIHWPPQDWQTLTGKKKLDKLVYAAITLDGGDAATTKPNIPFLLDKYNMLRLPGTEIPDMNIDAGKPSDMASIAKMSRYSTFHIIREMCRSESHSTNQLNLLKQVEAAWSVRDKTTDDITSRLDSAGVDLQLEDI
ncbi:uncharacterized protein LOC117315076 isoform X3 [Pecten maximus]|uniref:uncharacterized protein LOC117315076 isoform X3 n=1 Tax=Pecten maximus TaxID=6579 RepID=UPI001458A005|nr:uncharacterized protein LOC117315076 isoform X3 [Pecten maximus]